LKHKQKRRFAVSSLEKERQQKKEETDPSKACLIQSLCPSGILERKAKTQASLTAGCPFLVDSPKTTQTKTSKVLFVLPSRPPCENLAERSQRQEKKT
jgi:hypothetical protein